tara:strand:- start:362 stop:496 length:135 start_codon:yes stop_codon:yes gene_type:complete
MQDTLYLKLILNYPAIPLKLLDASQNSQKNENCISDVFWIMFKK